MRAARGGAILPVMSFIAGKQLHEEHAEFNNEVERLVVEIRRLRDENRELRAALGLQSQRLDRAQPWGSHETTAGTSIGPRRRRGGPR
jgi:hypothetical protein